MKFNFKYKKQVELIQINSDDFTNILNNIKIQLNISEHKGADRVFRFTFIKFK